jgi:hypothetical protein
MKTCILAVCFSALLSVNVAACDSSIRWECEKRLLSERLAAAGVPITEPALIQALQNDNRVVACYAAGMLQFLPKTPRTVAGLYSVLDDKDELLVIYATSSLIELGETSWERQNSERFPKMQDPLEKIRMAGLLARVNNTVGWLTVLDGLKSDQYVGEALVSVLYFDGKLYRGKKIDVRHELGQVLPDAPPAARSRIQSMIDSLKDTSQ